MSSSSHPERRLDCQVKLQSCSVLYTFCSTDKEAEKASSPRRLSEAHPLRAATIRTGRRTACLPRKPASLKETLGCGCDYPFTSKTMCVSTIWECAALFDQLMNCRTMTRSLWALWVESSAAWIEHVAWNKYPSELSENFVNKFLFFHCCCLLQLLHLITVCILVLHIYLLPGWVERKKEPHFGPGLAWPLTTGTMGKYISIRAPIV